MALVRNIAITFCLVASAGLGAELADYDKRLTSAHAAVRELLGNVAMEEAGEVPHEPTAEIFKAVRELVPPSEKVETENGTIETSNQWLHDALAAAEAEGDHAKRATALVDVQERLAAILTRLEELESAETAERAKDEDKRKLAEILNRPEYQKAPEPQADDSGNEWLRTFLEWIESWFPKFEPAGGAGPGVSSLATAVQFILIGLIVLLIGFILYKLSPLLRGRIRRANGAEIPERVILGETIDRDVSADDLFGDAERLARAGDVRGAIRKGYVALLCELADRRLIGLARHKTNRDYLRDVRSRHEVHANMNGLTGAFERHWYGSQPAAEADWEEFRRRCGDTIKAI